MFFTNSGIMMVFDLFSGVKSVILVLGNHMEGMGMVEVLAEAKHKQTKSREERLTRRRRQARERCLSCMGAPLGSLEKSWEGVES